MSELKGSTSDVSEHRRGSGRADDWTRIETERAQRDTISKRSDATHDPGPEFENAARPLGPDYGRDRHNSRTITPAVRTEMVELWGQEQVAKLEQAGRLVVADPEQSSRQSLDRGVETPVDQQEGRSFDDTENEDSPGSAATRAPTTDVLRDSFSERRERSEDVGGLTGGVHGAADQADRGTALPGGSDGDKDEHLARQEPRAGRLRDVTTVEKSEGPETPGEGDRRREPANSERPVEWWVDGVLLAADPSHEAVEDAAGSPGEDAAAVAAAGVELRWDRPELPAWARQDQPPVTRHAPTDQSVQGQPVLGDNQAAPSKADRSEHDPRPREGLPQPPPELSREVVETAYQEHAADGDGEKVLVLGRDGRQVGVEVRGHDLRSAYARGYLDDAGEVRSVVDYEDDPYVHAGVSMGWEQDTGRTMIGMRHFGAGYGYHIPGLITAMRAVVPEGSHAWLQTSPETDPILVEGRRRTSG